MGEQGGYPLLHALGGHEPDWYGGGGEGKQGARGVRRGGMEREGNDGCGVLKGTGHSSREDLEMVLQSPMLFIDP